MGVDWNDPATERILFLALLDRDLKVDWTHIATICGPDFRANGVRQKFYKLKRESDKLLADSGGAAGPSTPKGKTNDGGSARATPRSTNGKRKNKAASENEEDGPEKPKKKSKTGKADSKAAIKEDTEEDEE